MRTTPDAQASRLLAGTAHCVTNDELVDRLALGRPLRVKLGIDPTASDIHLGFAVVLRKLRQFQELGHTAVLILGDYTARVGDPTGRSATRPRLSRAEVDANAATYVDQIRDVLLPEPLEVRRNSEWLGAMGIDDVLALTGRTTVARMLERNDFAERYRTGTPISVLELLYPLLQGQDSVVVRADVELGGTDQLWNLLLARQLQEQAGQAPQVALTTPLLEGTDGVEKMSKSLANVIGIREAPGEQFGKLMSLPDALVPRYLALAADLPPQRVAETEAALASRELHPGAAKRLLARAVVDLYHGAGAGEPAEAGFDRVFKAGQAPEDVPDVPVPPAELADGGIAVARLLAVTGLVSSNNEGRRMIKQGAVRIDHAVLADPDAVLDAGRVDGRLLSVGKRRWARAHVEGA